MQAHNSFPTRINPNSLDNGLFDNTKLHGLGEILSMVPIYFCASSIIGFHFLSVLKVSKFFPTSLYSSIVISYALHKFLNADDSFMVPKAYI